MTEEIIETEAAEETQPAEEIDQVDEATPNRSREAAKYRKQLRDTEAERDTLRATVDALQRSMIETHIRSHHSVEPTGVIASAEDLNAFLNEDGTIDAEKTAVFVGTAVDKLGLKRYPKTPAVDPLQGRPVENIKMMPGWESLLQG